MQVVLRRPGRTAGALLALAGALAAAAPAAHAAAPTARIYPTQADEAGGTRITVYGENLTAVSSVTVDGSPVAFTAASVRGTPVLQVSAPAHAPGTVDVRVTNADGTSTNTSTDDLTYLAPTGQPFVRSISATTGPTTGGTAVTVTGVNLGQVDSVYFNSDDVDSSWIRNGDVTVISDTEVRFTTPEVVFPGERQVELDGPTGSSLYASAFFDFTGDPAGNKPILTALAPSHGPANGGNFVALTSRFTEHVGITGITVDGAAAQYTTNVYADPDWKPGNPILYGYVAPPHAPGTVQVRVQTDAGWSLDNGTADDYTYDDAEVIPAPVVTGLSAPYARADGTGDHDITVRGDNLGRATGVTVGGKPAVFSFIGGALRFTVPAQAAGKVDVRVTSPGGTSANTAADDLLLLGVDDLPAVTSIAPSSGPSAGGTVVTLTGRHLDLADQVGLTLPGSGETKAATNVTHVSDTELRFTTPAWAKGVIVTPYLWNDNLGRIDGDWPTFSYFDPPAPIRYPYALSGATNLRNLTKGAVQLTGSVDAELTTSTGAVGGSVKLNPSSANLIALNLLPLKASVAFTQAGPLTGTLTTAGLTVTTKQTISIKNVTLWGIKLVTGATCRTAQPSAITLKTPGAFAPLSGGTLTGSYAISNLTACGALNSIVSPLTAGSGNTVAVKLTPKAPAAS